MDKWTIDHHVFQRCPDCNENMRYSDAFVESGILVVVATVCPECGTSGVIHLQPTNQPQQGEWRLSVAGEVTGELEVIADDMVSMQELARIRQDGEKRFSRFGKGQERSYLIHGVPCTVSCSFVCRPKSALEVIEPPALATLVGFNVYGEAEIDYCGCYVVVPLGCVKDFHWNGVHTWSVATFLSFWKGQFEHFGNVFDRAFNAVYAYLLAEDILARNNPVVVEVNGGWHSAEVKNGEITYLSPMVTTTGEASAYLREFRSPLWPAPLPATLHTR
jgi:hypothetical protein